ncbi:MAG TPA: D-alanyl-D-alanine carboxypeptidase family protein [Streptosporangiaceae bacterium]|nr:D-alanyl-D-alanine carboxypeptidase family protein [Streptosporangiaceae bacterium]
MIAAPALLIATSARAAAPPARVARHVSRRVAPPLWAAYGFRWVEAHPSPDLGVTAAAGLLVDLDTRTVLWERNPDAPRAPASLTKMVTAMVALDLVSPDTELTVRPAMTDVIPDTMGVVPGEQLPVRDLLYGLFLDSGNDAAEVLAQAIVPRPLFIALMNRKVRTLGLTSTTFANPTGLDDPGNRSTAYDLAMIAGYLSTHYPLLMQIAGTEDHFIPATASHRAYEPLNLNKLLQLYPGATGLKTGLTDDAGGCLAGTATRGKHHLVSVILGSDVFFTDSEALLDYGFGVLAGGA